MLVTTHLTLKKAKLDNDYVKLLLKIANLLLLKVLLLCIR